MVDKEFLAERVKLLTGYIEDLEEEAGVGLKEIKEDKRIRRYVERTLHLAVEACLDIGNHLIADLGLREPETYKDIMVILTEAGYLPKEKIRQFKDMAGFRNVIVHDYTRVDPVIVYGILKKDLISFRLFAGMVKKNFLHREAESPSSQTSRPGPHKDSAPS
ncbi:MAG: DUF86 domain-containing protein [Peptococcaceae bacterium]|jgi:uncharacterized protein YutE (UPF0331/DUF86 family)|nr:DUF86 domain-containing protein [Peptococcaceae bacterium]